MERLNWLKDRHRGQRCVLVANGPSLNAMDTRFLRHEIAIGTNKIFLGFRKFGFYPHYYVAINQKVIEQSAADIKAINCVKFIGHRGHDAIPEDALTHHIHTKRPPQRFCHDISAGVHEGWTVTYVGLQLAYHLGFKEVVLIGLDHRYKYQGQPNQAQRLDGPDPNHFCPSYFGGGQTWDNPDLEQSEESYRIAKAEYEKDGRRIYDATLDGECTVFEKVPYQQYSRVH